MIEYRAIANFPGYRVGTDGSLWSCKKLISLGQGRGTRTVLDPSDWHRIAVYQYPKGYLQVNLYRAGNRRPHHRFIHRLVLEAFVGPCPDAMESRHLDGDPTNNRLDNLCWGTPKENSQDKRLHGTYPEGDNSPARKLCSEEVYRLKSLWLSDWGLGTGDLATLFGITTTQVRNILSGKSWTMVKGETQYV